jgi:hypothetical protein
MLVKFDPLSETGNDFARKGKSVKTQYLTSKKVPAFIEEFQIKRRCRNRTPVNLSEFDPLTERIEAGKLKVP